MTHKRKKHIVNPLTSANFPTIFERGKAKAFIVDIEKYREFEALVDNLINLREEDEDSLFDDAGILEKLAAKAKVELTAATRIPKWEDELDAL